MRTHKKVIFYSMLIIVLTFTISYLIEFRIIILCHSNFISNLLIGIFASSVLALVISIVSYFTEKRKALKELYYTMLEVGNACDYFFIWLSQYNQDQAIITLSYKNQQLIDNLKTLDSLFNVALLANGNYNPVMLYNNKINPLKKKQTIKNKFIYLDYIYNENISEVYIKARMTYEYLLRANLKTDDTEIFKKKFDNELSDLINLIDAKSKLHKAIEHFTPVLLKKLGIKEEPIKLEN